MKTSSCSLTPDTMVVLPQRVLQSNVAPHKENFPFITLEYTAFQCYLLSLFFCYQAGDRDGPDLSPLKIVVGKAGCYFKARCSGVYSFARF